MSNRLSKFFRNLKIKQQFFLSTGICVVFFFLCNIFYSKIGHDDFQENVREAFEEGVEQTYTSYLDLFLKVTANKVKLQFNSIFYNLRSSADLAQSILRNKKQLLKVNELLNEIPEYADKFDNKASSEQLYIGEKNKFKVYPKLGKRLFKSKKAILNKVSETRLLNLTLPVLYKALNSTPGTSVYFSGSQSLSYFRVEPNIGNPEVYPGFEKTEFWDFFSKDLLEFWKQKKKDNPKEEILTVIPPYEDADGKGLVYSFMMPIWNKNNIFEGALSVDFPIKELLSFIKGIQIGDSGFAFILNSEGNVVSVNERGAKFLGINKVNTVKRRSFLNRNLFFRSLRSSSKNQFRHLKLPEGEKTLTKSLTFDEGGTETDYLVSIRRSLTFSSISEDGLTDDSLFLGIVFPKKEIIGDFTKTESKIRTYSHQFLLKKFLLGMLFLISSIVFAYFIAKYLVKKIEILDNAVQQFGHADFKEIPHFPGKNEIAKLSQNFSFLIKIIEQKRLDLKKVNHNKDSYITRISHEFKTPLNSIIGMTTAMIMEPSSNIGLRVRSSMELVLTNGKRLLSLVSDLLDLSHIRNNNLELQIQEVSIYKVLQQVLTLTSPLIGKKQLQITNDVEKNLLVYADEKRLHQIILNLLDNAIKFSHSGIIEITAEAKEEELVVQIKDQGIGMPQSQLEKVFLSFEESSVISEKGMGLGLGLYITKKLLSVQKGRIWIQSEMGQGTNVFFSLPLSKNLLEPGDTEEEKSGGEISNIIYDVSNDEDRSEKEPKAAIVKRKLRILLVDDNISNIKVIKNYLSVLPCEFHEVYSGETALESIESEKPDLILLDVMMPGINGYQVCKTVRKKYSLNELPIVFFTAKNKETDLEYAYEIGANDFLTKPILGPEILCRIKTLLENIKSHKRAKIFIKFSEEAKKAKNFEDLILSLFESLVSEEINLEIVIFSEDKIAFKTNGDDQLLLELIQKNTKQVTPFKYALFNLLRDHRLVIYSDEEIDPHDIELVEVLIDHFNNTLIAMTPALAASDIGNDETINSPVDFSTLSRLCEIFNLLEKIQHIEASNNYVMLHFEDQSQEHLVRISMKTVLDSFKEHFVQIHRSFLVKRDKIISIEKNQKKQFVVLNKQKLQISKSYFDSVFNLISEDN